jgi:hypothetical protein
MLGSKSFRISNSEQFTVVLQNGVKDRNLEAGIDDEQQKLRHSCTFLYLVLAALDSLGSIYSKSNEFKRSTSFRFLQRFIRFLWG